MHLGTIHSSVTLASAPVFLVHMGQDIGTTIVKLTGGEGLGLGLEPTGFIQGQALPWLLFIPIYSGFMM